MHYVGFVDEEDMNVVSGRRKYSSVVGYTGSKLAQVSQLYCLNRINFTHDVLLLLLPRFYFRVQPSCFSNILDIDEIKNQTSWVCFSSLLYYNIFSFKWFNLFILVNCYEGQNIINNVCRLFLL